MRTYLIPDNLVILALCEVLHQFFIRYHVREPVGKRWVGEPTFLLFEFEVRVHRQVQRLKHSKRETGERSDIPVRMP